MRKLRSLPEPRLLAKRGCVTCRASQPGAAVRMLPMPLSSGRARRERSAVPLPGRALSAAARRALPRAPLCRSVCCSGTFISPLPSPTLLSFVFFVALALLAVSGLRCVTEPRALPPRGMPRCPGGAGGSAPGELQRRAAELRIPSCVPARPALGPLSGEKFSSFASCPFL